MAREKRLIVQRIEQKARTSTAIKAAINSNEIVAAIAFAVGLSFHDRRP
jgi:predicted DNA-binding protein with PD1-like motif